METIKAIYQHLFKRYGPQRWWPANSDYEIMLGAILTQNTNWGNVEKALENLAPYLTPSKILSLTTQRLAACLKPNGYYNQKAERV